MDQPINMLRFQVRMDVSMAKYMDPPAAASLKSSIDRMSSLFGDSLSTDVISHEVRLAYIEAGIDDFGSLKSLPPP